MELKERRRIAAGLGMKGARTADDAKITAWGLGLTRPDRQALGISQRVFLASIPAPTPTRIDPLPEWGRPESQTALSRHWRRHRLVRVKGIDGVIATFEINIPRRQRVAGAMVPRRVEAEA